MEKGYEQILVLILMDLVDHELLTTEEADLAKRIYLRSGDPAPVSSDECKAA